VIQTRQHRYAWHLVWSIPLALAVAAFAMYFSTMEWCGVSGCSGAGFGRISDPNLVAAILWLIAGCVIAAIPIMAVPWSAKRELRFVVALYYACVVGLVALVLIAPW
jgi:hypothetical protein